MKKFGIYVLERKSIWHIASDIYYRLDWRTNKIENLRDWFNDNLHDVTTDIKFREKMVFFRSIEDVDQRAVAILRHVKGILTYIGDIYTWKLAEKWQTPLETWLSKKGDCEDGALLIAAFFYHCNIPSNQWTVTCGDVIGGGHCWINYTSGSNALRYHLDWCYWYDDKFVPLRQPFFMDNKYEKIWFGFNDKKGWKSISNPNKKFR